jgi:dihydroxyacetone kinase-like protein
MNMNTGTIDLEGIGQWLREAGRSMEEHREYLTGLDAAIGDGDHGINMDRGFKKVAEMLRGGEFEDIAALLNRVGMTLITSVGGASGPLYGTFFMRAAAALKGRDRLSTADLASLFSTGTRGVMERGRAQPGDKTMIDALQPAAQAIEEALGEGAPIGRAVDLALGAARSGMEETVPMRAQKGRASYLGDRSIGHQDPGATSSYLIVKALHDVLEGSGMHTD